MMHLEQDSDIIRAGWELSYLQMTISEDLSVIFSVHPSSGSLWT